MNNARKNMDKIVGEIDRLMDEVELIRTDPDAWWKQRQQRLCKHENVVEEKDVQFRPIGPEDNQDTVYTYWVCKDCGKVIDE